MMTQLQFDRWKDFSLRMARTCWTNRNRPKRDWIVAQVQEFFEGVVDWQLIQDWDNSGEYPSGHPWHGPDTPYSSRLRKRSYICDEVTEFLDATTQPLSKRELRAWNAAYDNNNDERLEKLDEILDQKYFAPIKCCIRAGLDLAVAPSAGVLGFTAGDIRRMYPEGVPDWIANGGGWIDGEQKVDFNAIPDDEGLWL